MDAPAHVLLLLCFMRVAHGNVPVGINLDGIVAGAVAGAAAASGSTGSGCEFTISADLLLKPEPETNATTPLRTNFEIMIIGLREVKGGSFGIDVQYVYP